MKGNEEADNAAKQSFEQEVETTQENKMFENRQRAWLESGSEMVKRKPDIIRRHSSIESLPRRQKVVVSRLRMVNTNIITHSYRLESNPPPFCEEISTTATIIDHILWNCSVFNAAKGIETK
jgi:hypothetical protein